MEIVTWGRFEEALLKEFKTHSLAMMEQANRANVLSFQGNGTSPILIIRFSIASASMYVLSKSAGAVGSWGTDFCDFGLIMFTIAIATIIVLHRFALTTQVQLIR